MSKLIFSIFFVAFVFTANAQLKGALNKVKDAASAVTGGDLSQEEVGKGLKEALDNGVSDAVSFLSKPDGYLKSLYKIGLPEEATKVASKLKAVPGFNDVEDKLIEKMNRAAEDAAVKAKPIFVNAIKQMTFKDAMNILMGNQDAATRYLESATFKQLYAEFMPVIQASLDKVNAREYWRSAVGAYNKLPLTNDVNTELDDHVTTMALQGMFGLVAVKEKDIRSDVKFRTSDLLKKVFAKQDSKN
jgi:hypothetical protein